MLTPTIWTEKYRPQKLADTILPLRLKSTFQEFVAKKDVPNLLLHGSSGIGKTTVAKAMLNELGADFMVINASLDRNIDTLREGILNFASTLSFGGAKKFVILDEADYLNPNTFQPALRNFMEEYSANCGFILTCNYVNKILPALHSRCTLVDFKMKGEEKAKLAKQFFKRVQEILKAEGIQYDDKVVAELIFKWFPDFRRVLNELQRHSSSGKIDSGALASVSILELKDLFVFLKELDFTKTRKWCGENAQSDVTEFYTTLYQTLLPLLTPDGKPQAVMLLQKYQYEAAFSANFEINMCACLTHLMISMKGQWI